MLNLNGYCFELGLKHSLCREGCLCRTVGLFKFTGTFVSLAKPLNILACSFDFQFLSFEYFGELAIFSRLEGLVMVVCG